MAAGLLGKSQFDQLENTVKHVVTTFVIAPFLVSRPRRSHSTNSHLTSLDFLARAAPLPLHTFVRTLHNKQTNITVKILT